jgi:hypothetical protein
MYHNGVYRLDLLHGPSPASRASVNSSVDASVALAALAFTGTVVLTLAWRLRPPTRTRRGHPH